MKRYVKFGNLFRKYRLRAEFETLAEFINVLETEGLIYEESLLSRWQNGNRVPGDRNLWLIIIKIFARRKAISTINEANTFLESGGQGYLTKTELEKISFSSISIAPFFVPADISDFAGRENEIKTTIQELKTGKNIFVYQGIAGVGKTALVIRLAHLLKKEYSEGIFWFRVDITSSGKILDTIAQAFHKDISGIKDTEIKSSIVRSILSTKNTLLIFDNAENITQIHPLLPNSSASAVFITTRNKNLGLLPSARLFHLEPLDKPSLLKLYSNIMGEDYVNKNRKDLMQIGKVLGNLPLAISISAKQILFSNLKPKDYLTNLGKQQNLLESLEYENKNLLLSLDLGFKHLNNNERLVFLTSSIFNGRDFSSDAISFICNFPGSEAKSILENLAAKSLIEHSNEDRFRMHPLLKLYGEKNIFDKMLYKKAATYYEKFFSKGRRGNLLFYPNIHTEYENIISIFQKCYALNFRASLINLWEYFGVYLWDKGYWEKMQELGRIVYEATIKSNDDYSRSKCCIRELCWLYFWEGDVNMSEKYAIEGLRIAQKLKDDYLIAFAESRLGKINQAKDDFKKALQFFWKAVHFFETAGDDEKMGDIYTYIGETYWQMGQRRKAKYYLNSALRIVDKIYDIPQKITIISRLGCISLQGEQYYRAISYFEKSLLLEKESGRRVGDTFWNNLALGLTYKKLKDDRTAKEKFLLAKREMLLVGFSDKILHVDVFPKIFQKEIVDSGFYELKLQHFA